MNPFGPDHEQTYGDTPPDTFKFILPSELRRLVAFWKLSIILIAGGSEIINDVNGKPIVSKHWFAVSSKIILNVSASKLEKVIVETAVYWPGAGTWAKGVHPLFRGHELLNLSK